MFKNNKRSERRFLAKVHAVRQIEILKSHNLFNEHFVLGKFKKLHALTCGSSRCHQCGNPRKFFGTRTLKEDVNALDFEEQLNDLE